MVLNTDLLKSSLDNQASVFAAKAKLVFSPKVNCLDTLFGGLAKINIYLQENININKSIC